jgi:tetratricopeptide (TPR) repeat protein
LDEVRTRMRIRTSGPILVILWLTSLGCTVETGDLPAPAPPPSVTAPSEAAPLAALASVEESMRPLLDPRASRLRPRAPALVETEVAGLEAQWSRTPKDAADRAALGRRLAEDYVELESAALRDDRPADVQRARNEALKYYDLLVEEYPSDPKLDEILYYVAREYELAKDGPRTRKAYYQLIVKRPESGFIPRAYLAFGELFFDEASIDPSKWDLAKQAYQKVISYPPPNNAVYGYAWYKLAHTFWKSGELDKALRAFKKTIDYGETFKELPGATRLTETARTDILSVCRDKHDASQACASGDAPADPAETPEPDP